MTPTTHDAPPAINALRVRVVASAGHEFQAQLSTDGINWLAASYNWIDEADAIRSAERIAAHIDRLPLAGKVIWTSEQNM